jgi:U-box domain
MNHSSSSGPMTRNAKRMLMASLQELNIHDELKNNNNTTARHNGDNNTILTATNNEEKLLLLNHSNQNKRVPSGPVPVQSTSSMHRNINDDFLIDPISLERMQDPVLLVPSGHTVDKKYLCQWLLTHPNSDPVTGVIHDKPIAYIDNILIRQLLMDQHGDSAYIKYPYDVTALRNRQRRMYIAKGMIKFLLIAITASLVFDWVVATVINVVQYGTSTAVVSHVSRRILVCLCLCVLYTIAI